MAVVRDIYIKNFRGIRDLRWQPTSGINCLIGPGDSCKTTILDAIDYTIGARRQIAFTDVDFHGCDTSNPIEIYITLGALDRDLQNIEKYGHFHRGFDISKSIFENEPSVDLETVLTLSLIVREGLEPEWTLYSEGPSAQGRERNITWKHRQEIAPTRLGTSATHHLSFGPRSILNKLSSDKAQASSALAAAARQARQTFAEEGFEGINDVLETAKNIANEMSIPVLDLKALLDVKGISFSGGAIALHDENHIPLRVLGSGSSRLLVAGLQKSLGRSAISIIDEVEFGLEPFRIVRLLDALGCKEVDSQQQVFMTTHSPIVLKELSASQLHVVRAMKRTAHITTGREDSPEQPSSIQQNTVTRINQNEDQQRTLRACAEAFLAPSVIVCEGKTEMGLLRGLDLHCQDHGHKSILALGNHWANGGGNPSMFNRALTFGNLGYRTALFMDSDVPVPQDILSRLREVNVSVFCWPEGQATEDVIFNSVPSNLILQLLSIAEDWKSADSVDGKIRAVSNNQLNLHLCQTAFTDDMRPLLAKCAKEKNWFKDVEPAERVMREVIGPHLRDCGGDLISTINALWRWIKEPSTEQSPPRPGE